VVPKIRCSGQASGCDRCIAIAVECRYRDRSNRRRRRQTSDLGTTTDSSITVVNGNKRSERPYPGPSSGTGENIMREAFDDWSLDMNKLLDPMLPTQLGSPNNLMDTASEIAWDAFLRENSGTVGQ
jgi:hypothetical protein